MKKSELLIEDIKKKIDTGVFNYGMRLPSTNSLAEIYGITSPTVHKAVRKLVEMGYVYRKQGEGTYVSKNIKSRTKKVILAIETKGHLFAELAQEIFHLLQEAGFSCEVISLREGYMPLPSITNFENALSDNPYAIIAEYRDEKQYLELMKRASVSGIPIIWTMYHTAPPGYSGHVVGHDIFTGVYSILQYLTSLGHRDIVCFAIEEFFFSDHPFLQAIDAIKRNYPDIKIHQISGEPATPYEKQIIPLREILISSSRPTAIVCSLDYRAKLVMDLANELSIKVPDELSVTGFYNTPWAESYDLTTVDVHIKDMAYAIVDILENLSKARSSRMMHRILIEPELIIRSSTGPVPLNKINKG